MGHQERVENVRRVWALQGFELVSVEIEEAEENRKGRRVKQIRLLDRRKTHGCGECGKTHREVLFPESEERRWRDRSLRGLSHTFRARPFRG